MNLPNGCNVYWQNSYGNGQGSSYTYENSNCAAVEAKMHANLAGPTGWVTVTSGYVNGSYASVARYVDEKPAYSDHNGKKTTRGTANGFRKSF